VPAPVGHGIAGEGLQTRSIGAEAQLAIAQGQTPGHLIPGDVVSRHQRVPVDVGFASSLRCDGGVQRGERSQQQGGESDEDLLHECAQVSASAAFPSTPRPRALGGAFTTTTALYDGG